MFFSRCGGTDSGKANTTENAARWPEQLPQGRQQTPLLGTLRDLVLLKFGGIDEGGGSVPLQSLLRDVEEGWRALSSRDHCHIAKLLIHSLFLDAPSGLQCVLGSSS